MNALFVPLVIGWPQIILIILVVLLLFGGKKIPEMMRGLGGGLKEFKNASKDDVAAKKPEDRRQDDLNPERPLQEERSSEGKI